MLARVLRPALDRLTRYRAFRRSGPFTIAPDRRSGVAELYTGVPVAQAGLAVLPAVLLVPGRVPTAPDEDPML